jgi:integrase
VRYLQPTELRAVLAACPEWLKPVVGLAVATGMRRSEVQGLRWLDVNMKNARVMPPQAKNGDGQIAYMNQSALAALRSAPRSPETKATGLIFAGVTPA